LKGPVSVITSKYSADIYCIARPDDRRKFITLNWQYWAIQTVTFTVVLETVIRG